RSPTSTLFPYTTLFRSSGERPFERIIQQASAYQNLINGIRDFDFPEGGTVVTPEPVPRWRKRPQELILQGSNNTLICLGEDRKRSEEHTSELQSRENLV